jgi:glycosyltransferase involved in cell wall biosynthesis
MKPMQITIILPFPVTKPVGGARIMYEYANRFAAKGHQVVVLHALHRPYKKMKSPRWWKQFIFWIQGAARPHWFPLLPQVSSRIVAEITDAYVPLGDIVFSTWWQMTYAVANLSPSRGAVINLVQDFENWMGQESLVLASYRLPVHHAAISTWLQQKVQQESEQSVQLLPNAIDTDQFFIRTPMAHRKSDSVMALYSEEKRKGTIFILEALPQLKERYPALQFTFFGVYPRPATLPTWVQYIQKPSNLSVLYNAHAIFLSASLGEGWALPPAEAMACGCAVICTEIGGHADYAVHGETALLIPVQDPASIVEAVSKLIANDHARQHMAEKGHQQLVARYNWEHSVDLALEWFTSLQKG